MILVILLGVLSVLLFLCISNVVISSMPLEAAARNSSNIAQMHSESAPLRAHRSRFVTLLQGVTKAIGAAFGRGPSGRRVPETVAIALMTSWVSHGFAVVIRLRAHR
jgi:hypothetical protein